MAGALYALQIGAVMIDQGGKVIACCAQFASFLGRPQSQILGRQGRDFMRPEDVPSALRFLTALWETGVSFTFTTRLLDPRGGNAIFESHVSRLIGEAGPVALSVVRPFNCKIQATEPDPRIAASKAGYVVDMSAQLAEFAADAFMPVTCDLLRVAADAAAHEGGECVVPKRA